MSTQKEKERLADEWKAKIREKIQTHLTEEEEVCYRECYFCTNAKDLRPPKKNICETKDCGKTLPRLYRFCNDCSVIYERCRNCGMMLTKEDIHKANKLCYNSMEAEKKLYLDRLETIPTMSFNYKQMYREEIFNLTAYQYKLSRLSDDQLYKLSFCTAKVISE